MRKLIIAVTAALLALPLVAEAQNQTGDLTVSCQVSTASNTYNGVAVRSRVESSQPASNGEPSTVPAGTRGCAYFLNPATGKVVVNMPVTTRFGVSPQDREYVPGDLTGAN